MGIKSIYAYLIVCLAVFTSCGLKETDEPGPERDEEKGQMSVSFQVRAVNGTGSDEEISEKIGSLRIIMLSDGFIEYNSKINFDEGSDPEAGGNMAKTFSHLFQRATVPGNKRFYLIANEESVDEVLFEGAGNTPDWIEGKTSLTAFLDHYSKDKLPAEGTIGYEKSGSGREFEGYLNSLYFKPDYTVANNTVYLPYTAYYDGFTATSDPNHTEEMTMYLVPVATKFTFNLINFRDEEVDVKAITIGRVNSTNFLMASLADNEKTKKLDGTEYYWIDWLEKVVRGTHDAYEDGDEELSDYNASVGWIKNYFAPESSPLVNYVATPGEGGWKVKKTTDKDNPESISVEFYCPESIKTGRPSEDDPEVFEDGSGKIYFVRFEIQEKSANTPTLSEWMELDALPALFRCTHLIVDVDMYQSLVKIYCEMAPWDVWTFKGFVKEEED